jgi:hypothetical protein
MNILKSWQIYREFWSFRLSQKIGYLIGDNRMLDFKFDVLLIPLGILGFIIAIFKNRLNYKEYGLIAFALYLNAIHVMFCGDPRYRIPLVPILSLYSSYLLVLAAGTILGNQKK